MPEQRWLVNVLQDEAADENQETPVTGVILNINSEKIPQYQLHEYQYEHINVDPQYSSSQNFETPAKQHPVSSTGTFFESSVTRKDWFSMPDLDASCSQSSSSTPVSSLFYPIAKKTTDFERADPLLIDRGDDNIGTEVLHREFREIGPSTAVFTSENNSSHACAPTPRIRRIYHM